MTDYCLMGFYILAQFNCHMAPLETVAAWISSDGQRRNYFDGDGTGADHFCQCSKVRFRLNRKSCYTDATIGEGYSTMMAFENLTQQPWVRISAFPIFFLWNISTKEKFMRRICLMLRSKSKALLRTVDRGLIRLIEPIQY